MRRRLTARVLLFDPQDRLLMMKGRLPRAPGRVSDGPGAWFTVGGGVQPGETVEQAAAREIREETGFTEFTLGPVIGRREGALPLSGETVWMDEYYLVARTPGGEPARHGWDADEQALIDDIRWWTLAELATTGERVFPPGLAELLPEILAGRLPDPPRAIAWS